VRRPSTFVPAPVLLQEIWETRTGRFLRRLGLDGVRRTIVTLAVLATLIPALATGIISYRQNSRAITAKLDQQLTGSSGQSAREVGLWLKERLQDLRVFAVSYEVTENMERGGGGSRRLPEYLSSVKERFPDFDELMVVGPDRRVVASSERVAGTLSLGEGYLQQARMGDPVLGEPARRDSADAVTVEVAVPIVGVTGRFLGVLGARLNFSQIEEPLRGLIVGGDGRIAVVRSDGALIASIGGASALPSEVVRRLVDAGGTGVPYRSGDGVEVLGAATDVPRTEWKVVAEVPAATAYAEIRAVRNATVLLVLVLLAVVGSLAYGLGLLIVLPLERLTRAANLVATGHLDVDVPSSGSGEIAQLAGVFNEMVGRLRETREVLERLSVTDELTGLANRRQLTFELEREVQRSERHERSFAVLLLDVDRFKQFNDTYGHPAGDAVLKRLANVLRESSREVDTVARYGGEEFLVIVPEADAAAAAAVAERIRAGAERDRFTPEGFDTELNVTVSIGYAVFPQHARTPERLVEAADQALYRSKEGGRNRVTAAEGAAGPPKPRKRKSSSGTAT